MTEKGRQFTLESRRKAALDGKRKFNRKLLLFENLLSESRSRDAIKSELQTLKVLAENTSQEFVDCLNLTTETEDISAITSEQQDLQVSWERIRSKALHRLDYLDSRDETKSNSSHGSRRSNFSQRSAKSNTSCKDALLGATAKRAVLEQRLRFSDSVKDQEKALAKLKIQQELSETLAKEAVYRVAFNEDYQESEGESVHNLPTGFASNIDTFLHDQESYFPAQSSVTQSLKNVTQSSVPLKESSVSVTQPLVPVIQPSVPLKQSSASVTQSLVPVTQSSVPVTQLLLPAAQPSVPVTQPPSITRFTDPVTQASVSVAYPFSLGFQSSTTVSQSLPLVTPNGPSFSTCTPVCQSSSDYSLPRSSSSFLSSLYTASTRRYPLTVTGQDTITCTVSSSVHSPSSFNVDYQPGTPYPRSLYGNSPLYVTPQPSQISPMYVMPSPDNTQQITEALAKVTQLQRLPQAVPDVFNGEEKDKTRFFLWETAFNALIDSAPVTPQQKLHLLFQHLGGRAKKVVEQLQFMSSDPERAYIEARKKLKERFGHSAILSTEFESKLSNWPKIGNNDAKGIQEFSDYLQQVELATEHIPNLKIFEYSSKLQSLVEKLPSWSQSKWSNKVQKLQQAEGQNAFPSFSVFVKEVTFHAERMNIPQISQTTPVSGNRRNVTSLSVTPSRGGLQSSKGRDQSSPVTALTTHMNPDSEQSSEGNKPVENSTPLASSQSQMTPATPKSAFCPFHRTKSHNLDGCQKFRELDFAKRRDFLFRHKLCFNCAKSTEHTSRNCSQRPSNCEICGNKHSTLLHDPSRPENQTTPTSSACTQVCNRGPARSCARIVLLKVSDRSVSSKEVMTYAVLDDQSTDAFVTDSLLEDLDVSGQEVNLQVNTIVGTNTLRMRKVSGLQIQDVNEEHSPVKVPYAYAQESIPATHHDIATPDIARQWEHLKVIADKISHQPQIGIGMLIGRNIPTAFPAA